ncbi:MAG: hypothetical protein V7676_17665 [Parasphingorhabdus sp.]|uniref:hypothetical protein n=1 Tax=Pseudomonadota TaxID=1224 RepID=UPI003002F3ED
MIQSFKTNPLTHPADISYLQKKLFYLGSGDHLYGIYFSSSVNPADDRQTPGATCKSEEFIEFARWLFFANGGKIPANLKHGQSKTVKHNHFVCNLVQRECDDRGI